MGILKFLPDALPSISKAVAAFSSQGGQTGLMSMIRPNSRVGGNFLPVPDGFGRCRIPPNPNRRTASNLAEGYLMDENNAINVVENLIETSKDSQKGYHDAAEHVKSPALKTYFNEQSAERAGF